MSIFGGGASLSGYAKTDYVEVQDGLRVLKAGDTMSGDLYMGDHRIKEVADPAEPQDAATKKYVDNRKPLITVWAEENGSMAKDEYEWSFGNGAAGGNADRGYPMLAAGRVLRMGLAVSGSAPAAASVNVVANRVVYMSYGVTKPSDQNSGTSIFRIPLELARGDRVNFRSASTNSGVTTAVVSLLIELDL